jgi:hypothetical protein
VGTFSSFEKGVRDADPGSLDFRDKFPPLDETPILTIIANITTKTEKSTLAGVARETQNKLKFAFNQNQSKFALELLR